jgi:hypothetical protein
MLIKLFKKLFSAQNKVDDNSFSIKDDSVLQTHITKYDKSPESIAEGKQKISKPNLTEIGNIDSICPYCSVAIIKKPLRKSKCPHCGQYIYVRIRPIDRQRVLVTLEQASEIEVQWTNFPQSYIYDHIDPKEIEFSRNEYFKKKGVVLSDADAKWYFLNQKLLEHSKNADWGLYRNTRLSMGSVLEHDHRKVERALHTYLEVCYFDINGPRNLSGLSDPELLEKFPPFSSGESFLAPAVVTKILELSGMLHLKHSDIKTIFMEAAGTVFRNLKLPVTPVQAWEQFEKVYNA